MLITGRRRRSRVGYVLRSAIGWALSIVFLLPFFWMISSSLKRNADVFAVPVEWIPDPIRWQNYLEVWLGDGGSMALYFANSAFVTSLGVIGDLTTASMAGYAFAKMRFRGRDKVFLLYLATAIIPHQLVVIPRFMFFQQIGLYDTLWALILPGIFTVFGTFLFRQYFVALPDEYGNAARVDGAGEWTVFFRVYLPMAKPVIATLAIVSFVGSWNDYENPLIMLVSPQLYTVPLGLTRFVDADGGLSGGLAMAGSVSSLVPIVVVFLVFQRQFVAAMVRSGID